MRCKYAYGDGSIVRTKEEAKRSQEKDLLRVRYPLSASSLRDMVCH